MPKKKNIKKIMVIGSGPIVIGQAVIKSCFAIPTLRR